MDINVDVINELLTRAYLRGQVYKQKVIMQKVLTLFTDVLIHISQFSIKVRE